MVHVDPELLKQLDEGGLKLVPVVITCRDKCEAVVEALEQAGVKITSKESMVFGVFSAEITDSEGDLIKSQPEVSAIEYDQEANIQSNTRKGVIYGPPR